MRPELDGTEIGEAAQDPARAAGRSRHKFLLGVPADEGVVGPGWPRERLLAWWAGNPVTAVRAGPTDNHSGHVALPSSGGAGMFGQRQTHGWVKRSVGIGAAAVIAGVLAGRPPHRATGGGSGHTAIRPRGAVPASVNGADRVVLRSVKRWDRCCPGRRLGDRADRHTRDLPRAGLGKHQTGGASTTMRSSSRLLAGPIT